MHGLGMRYGNIESQVKAMVHHGDLRTGSQKDGPAAGAFPNPSQTALHLKVNLQFWCKTMPHPDHTHAWVHDGDPINDLLAKMAPGEFGFLKHPDLLHAFCEAHGIDEDLYTLYLGDPAAFRAKAMSDANAALIMQADALAGIVNELMDSFPELVVLPVEDVASEGDATNAHPVYRMRPSLTAGDAAERLLKDGTSTVGADPAITVGGTQVIQRLHKRHEVDKMTILMAQSFGNDIVAAMRDNILFEIGKLFSESFYNSTFVAATMVPDGLAELYDSTNNEVAIDTVTATLDSTNISTLDQMLNTLKRLSPGAMLFMNETAKLRLDEINRADRQFMDTSQLAVFGRRIATYDGRPIIVTDALGNVEQIDGTATGGDATSIWAINPGVPEGVSLANLRGAGLMDISVGLPVEGTQQLAYEGTVFRSGQINNTRSAGRLLGVK